MNKAVALLEEKFPDEIVEVVEFPAISPSR